MATKKPSIIQDIVNAATSKGIAPWLMLDIATHESSLKPNANGKDTNGAYSTGLFQLNQKGVGAGYTVAQLKNPILNANLAASAMAGAYRVGINRGYKGIQLLDYTANSSGWPGSAGPGNYPKYDKQLNAVYSKMGGATNRYSQYQAMVTAASPSANVTTTGAASLGQQLDSLLNPTTGGIAGDVRMIGARAGFVLLGLLLVAFGLAAAIKSVASDMPIVPV